VSTVGCGIGNAAADDDVETPTAVVTAAAIASNATTNAARLRVSFNT